MCLTPKGELHFLAGDYYFSLFFFFEVWILLRVVGGVGFFVFLLDSESFEVRRDLQEVI